MLAEMRAMLLEKELLCDGSAVRSVVSAGHNFRPCPKMRILEEDASGFRLAGLGNEPPCQPRVVEVLGLL